MQVIGLKRQEWIFILQFELVIMHPEWNLIWILFRPQSFRLAFQMWQIGTLIFNIDAHTQKCGHWHIVTLIESRIMVVMVPVMIVKWRIEQFVQNNFCSRFIHIPRVFNVWSNSRHLVHAYDTANTSAHTIPNNASNLLFSCLFSQTDSAKWQMLTNIYNLGNLACWRLAGPSIA